VSQQRRLQTRHDVEVPATLEVEGQVWEGQFQNLSLGGAFLSASFDEAQIKSGTRGHVNFRIPTQEEPISVGASIRWCSASGVGLQFDGLRAREVWSLNKYFEQLGC
jgi:hypothetical protein